jgi:hypothetical protein
MKGHRYRTARRVNGVTGVVESLMSAAKGLDHVVTVWPALVNYFLECISP